MRTLVAITIGLALCLVGSPARASTTPTVYLALGDSLAVGVGASSPYTGYVPRLFRYFGGASHGGVDTLTNLAISGETSASFLTRQLGPAVLAIQDPASDIAVVTLDIGGNDLLALQASGACDVPQSATCQAAVANTLATFAANYQIILANLRTALLADPGDEQLYVLTVYNLLGGTGDPREGLVDAVLLGTDGTIDCAANALDPTKVGLNDLIGCIGIAFGAVVADGYGAIDDRASVLINEGDIHPNDAGYAALARAFIAAAQGR